MFRIAICDDMSQERDIIKEKLRAFFEREDLNYTVDEFQSGELLAAECSDGEDHYDLILLDIFMGEVNGYECAKRIRQTNRYVPIAFLTTSRDYAIESYDVEAAGYLVKPVEDAKLFTLLSKLTRTETPKRLSLMKKGRVKSFDYRDIVYIESQAHVITVHLTGGEEETAYAKLDDLALDDQRFLRCHKSYIVNMDFVKYAEEVFHMTDGETVPIRTRERKKIVDEYTKYFVKKHMGGEIR